MSNDEPILSEEQELAIMLEAARRANWDALYGPRHLRTGRYRPTEAVNQPGTKATASLPEVLNNDHPPDTSPQ